MMKLTPNDRSDLIRATACVVVTVTTALGARLLFGPNPLYWATGALVGGAVGLAYLVFGAGVS